MPRKLFVDRSISGQDISINDFIPSVCMHFTEMYFNTNIFYVIIWLKHRFRHKKTNKSQKGAKIMIK